MIRILVFVAGLSAASSAIAQTGGQASAGPIVIDHAWARETPPTASSGGIYLDIANSGDVADRLVAATAERARMAHLHTTEMEDGVMRMRTIEALEVPAGGSASLAPGGDHIMLMGLDGALVEGTTLMLRLEFETAGTIEIEVPVEDIGFTGY